MPWCGTWGTAGSPFWWILPVIGVFVVAVMFFACFRRFRQCSPMGGCRCKPDQAGRQPAAGIGRPT